MWDGLGKGRGNFSPHIQHLFRCAKVLGAVYFNPRRHNEEYSFHVVVLLWFRSNGYPSVLTCPRRQMVFLGAITDQRLKIMLKEHNSLILRAIKWMLGADFLEDEGHYCVSTSISSRFVASLVDLGEPTMMVRALTLVFFKKMYLGRMEDVNNVVRRGVGILWPGDIHKVLVAGEVVEWLPSSNFYTMTLMQHRAKPRPAWEFLKCITNLEPVYDLGWLNEFA